MNTVKIYEAKLSVSLAKYDKNHARFDNQQVLKGPEPHRYQNQYRPPPAPVYVPVRQKEDGVTYGEALVGKEIKKPPRKVIMLQHRMNCDR
ncbi:hypothetical protein Hanom_Chr16g01506371 [Helianthus anomalus]